MNEISKIDAGVSSYEEGIVEALFNGKEPRKQQRQNPPPREEVAEEYNRSSFLPDDEFYIGLFSQRSSFPPLRRFPEIVSFMTENEVPEQFAQGVQETEGKEQISVERICRELKLFSDQEIEEFQDFLNLYLPETSSRSDIVVVKAALSFLFLKGKVQTQDDCKKLVLAIPLLVKDFDLKNFIKKTWHWIDHSIFAKTALFRKSFFFMLSVEAMVGSVEPELRSLFLKNFQSFPPEKEKNLSSLFYKNYAEKIQEVKELARNIFQDPSKEVKELISEANTSTQALISLISMQKEIKAAMGTSTEREELRKKVWSLWSDSELIIPAHLRHADIWECPAAFVAMQDEEKREVPPTLDLLQSSKGKITPPAEERADLSGKLKIPLSEEYEHEFEEFYKLLMPGKRSKDFESAAEFAFCCLSGQDDKWTQQMDQSTLQRLCDSATVWMTKYIYPPLHGKGDPNRFRDSLHCLWILEGIAGEEIASVMIFVEKMGGMNPQKLGYLRTFFFQRNQQEMEEFKRNGLKLFGNPSKIITALLSEESKRFVKVNFVVQIKKKLIQAAHRSNDSASVTALQKNIEALMRKSSSIVPTKVRALCNKKSF
jgi:hypothetical protein